MTDHTERLMRNAIDMATAAAIGEAREDIEKAGCGELMHRVARLAATLSVEAYRAYHRSEVAMVEFHHESRVKAAMLRQPFHFIRKDPT